MIYLGGDHAGFILKEKIKVWLQQWDYEWRDLGTPRLEADDDYPDFVVPVARRVSRESQSSGIILGRSGQGEAITANRFKGVRAAVYYGGPASIVKLAREHNNANILSLGAGFIDEETARSAIKLWLETEFSAETRHHRRLDKIELIEGADV